MYLTSLSLFPCLCVPNNDDFPTILIYVACFRARLKSDTIMLMVMLGYVKRRKKMDGFVEQIHDWQKKKTNVCTILLFGFIFALNVDPLSFPDAQCI